MKLLCECGISAAGFFISIALTFIIVPAFIRYLRKKETESGGFSKGISFLQQRSDLIEEVIKSGV
jgi:hypothetical protein